MTHKSVSVLGHAEDAMRGRPVYAAGIYDRVCGKAVDPEYEKLRRAATLRMMARNAEDRIRPLIWC